MWLRYLESQLLRRVDPLYEYGHFYSESGRPPRDYAPIFSWVALDAPQGIKFSPIADQGLLLEARTHNISLEEKDNQFGLIANYSKKNLTCLEPEGVLKRIEMEAIQSKFDGQESARHDWCLVNVPNKRNNTTTTKQIFRNNPFISPYFMI
jgi:hypothetical protein